jgi:hypothetical protein
MSSYRDRVKALYDKYDPEKSASTDATLAKYAGKEEQLIKALVKKYGPEPEAPAAAAAAAPTPRAAAPATPRSGEASFRDRVKALYDKYDPEKSASTDATLAKYAGKEEQLIKALVKKYGPEPEGGAGGGASPTAASPSGAPATPQQTPRTNAAGEPSIRDRVKALYDKYDPEKSASTDATLAKYAGKEEQLLKALVKKYGPEPERPTAAAAGSAAAVAPSPSSAPPAAAAQQTPRTTSAELSIRDRVKALYDKYDPEKSASTDATLAKYAGKEEQLLKALVKKYGPEPEGGAATATASPTAAAAPTAPATPRTTGSGELSIRDRVKALYDKYDPEKSASTDATLAKYAGKEEQLLKALVKKYGPEPEVTAASASSPPAAAAPAATPTAAPPAAAAAEDHQGASPLSHKDRLAALYAKYDPEKVSQVDSTLAKYAGKEEQMLKALVKKYGPEPTPPATPRVPASPAAPAPSAAAASGSPQQTPRADLSHRDRVKALYDKYDPEKSATTDATLAKYAGKEEQLIKALVKKYGPEPEAPAAAAEPSTAAPAGEPAAARTHRERVKAMYDQYDPDKSATVDATLAKYVGKEEQLIKALVKKYGPEPEGAPSAAASPAASPAKAAPPVATTAAVAAAPPKPLTHRDRVKALYEKYDPEKSASTDATLAKYAGKEEQLIKALVKKYGPEPEGGAAETVADEEDDAPPSPPPAAKAAPQKVSFAALEAPPAATAAKAPTPTQPTDDEEDMPLDDEDEEVTPAAPDTPRDQRGTAVAPPPSAAAVPGSPMIPPPSAEATPIRQQQQQQTSASGGSARTTAAAELPPPRAGAAATTVSAKASRQRSALLLRGVESMRNSVLAVLRADRFELWGLWAREHARQAALDLLLTPRAGTPAAGGGVAALTEDWSIELEGADESTNDAAAAPAQTEAAAATATADEAQPTTPRKRILVNKRTGKRIDADEARRSSLTGNGSTTPRTPRRGTTTGGGGGDASLSMSESGLRPVVPLPLIAALSALPTSELYYPMLPAPTQLSDVLSAVEAAHRALAVDLPAAQRNAADARDEAARCRAAAEAAAERQQMAEKELLEATERLGDATEEGNKLREALEQANRDIDEVNDYAASVQEQVLVLQRELEAERAGVPTGLEEECWRKDELASHLHAQLASARTKITNLRAELAEATDALEQERRVAQKLRQHAALHLGGLIASPARPRAGSPNVQAASILAPTFSSAKKAITPRTFEHVAAQRHHERLSRSPSADPNSQQQLDTDFTAPSYLQGLAFRHPDAPSHIAPSLIRHHQHQHQPYTMATSPPPYYASNASHNKPQPAGANQEEVVMMLDSPRATNNTDAAATHNDTDSDFSPSPSASADPRAVAGAAAGVNATPTPQPTAPATTTAAVGTGITESVERVRTAADDLDEFLPADDPAAAAAAAEPQRREDRGNCPNCTIVALTPYFGNRVGGADNDKVAFCFSCRTAFTRHDLHVRDLRRDNKVYVAKRATAATNSTNKPLAKNTRRRI